MEKTRIVKSQSKHTNLPAELWSEILSRLPVKSLLRFRCVSKSWRSMIEDPNFCRSHLNNFKNNSLETHLLVVRISAREHVCAIYCSKTFTNSVVLDPLQPCNGSTKNHLNSRNWHIVCSLDGLVLLTLYTPTLKLTLWNPSIRRSRVLHVSRTRSESVKYFELGFGFDPIIKDYKHVRFVKCGESNLHSIELYTVGSGTWRTIQYQDAGGSKWRWNFCDSYRWRRLCFRGILYFTPSRINSGVQELVSFNLNSEVFGSTSFPMDDDDPFSQLTPLLHDGGCLLGLAVVSFTGGSIWVLESSGGDINSMCWTKHYTFALNAGYWNHFLYIKKDGELLIQRPKIVTSYDLETHEEKTLVNDHEFGVSMSRAYTESLLLLHG